MLLLDEVEKAIGNEYLNNSESVELDLTIKEINNNLEHNTQLVIQPYTNKIVHIGK